MKHNNYFKVSTILFLLLFYPTDAFAMHIMEGFLPVGWVIFWGIISLPIIIFGLGKVNQLTKENSSIKMLLALAGAFVFVLSALKIPSVTGSSSHMTGVGLGAILFGPWAASILGLIVLIFQALLLAHGGITTLGANVFSMAIVGTMVAYLVHRGTRKLGFPSWMAVFLGAALGDLCTYIVTAVQLALAFPDSTGGVAASFLKFMTVFGLTQIPLAVSEGVLTVIIFNILYTHNKHDLQILKVVSEEADC